MDWDFSGDVAELDSILRRYPWFTTGRILHQAATGITDKTLELHLQTWPRPRVLLPAQPCFTHAPTPKADDPIERFLAHGEYKITPAEDITDDNIAAASEYFEADETAATEQLAEIYLAQGLRNEAAKIYRRLGLQNPEKSAYFAGLIEKIDE